MKRFDDLWTDTVRTRTTPTSAASCARRYPNYPIVAGDEFPPSTSYRESRRRGLQRRDAPASTRSCIASPIARTPTRSSTRSQRGVASALITEQEEYRNAAGCGTRGTSIVCGWPASRSGSARTPASIHQKSVHAARPEPDDLRLVELDQAVRPVAGRAQPLHDARLDVRLVRGSVRAQVEQHRCRARDAAFVPLPPGSRCTARRRTARPASRRSRPCSSRPARSRTSTTSTRHDVESAADRRGRRRSARGEGGLLSLPGAGARAGHHLLLAGRGEDDGAAVDGRAGVELHDRRATGSRAGAAAIAGAHADAESNPNPDPVPTPTPTPTPTPEPSPRRNRRPRRSRIQARCRRRGRRW